MYKEDNRMWQDDIEKAIEAGHLERLDNGTFRMTGDAQAYADYILATNRAARIFYREMNHEKGLPEDSGLPEWKGEGDEFDANGGCVDDCADGAD